jgi:hypothetical protein
VFFILFLLAPGDFEPGFEIRWRVVSTDIEFWNNCDVEQYIVRRAEVERDIYRQEMRPISSSYVGHVIFL